MKEIAAGFEQLVEAEDEGYEGKVIDNRAASSGVTKRKKVKSPRKYKISSKLKYI